MSLSQQLDDLSLASNAVIYDRLSTPKQVASFDTHLPILRHYASQRFQNIREFTEIGSAYNNHRSLHLYDILEQKDFHLIVIDESRLSRNLEGAGLIVDLIKRNRITVHVVGG